MSLKYRLIILTTLVFAAALTAGALLGMRGAQDLAEAQVCSRLERSAAALADSSAPLNDEALARIAPLLDAEILVLDGAGRVTAHSAASLTWEALAETVAARPSGMTQLSLSSRNFLIGKAVRTGPRADIATVVLLADESVAREPARTILKSYLLVLAMTAVPLWVGLYLVGWALVRRINRLNRRIDQTLSEEPVPGSRGGDELRRLQSAFDGLLERLSRSRERLAAQQRLATTGKLASSIAHEVRNPLQAIRLTVQMLREKVPVDQRQGFDLVIGEIDRLGLLADELLVLADKDALRVEPVDLAAQVNETLRLLGLQLRQRQVRTEVRLPPLPSVPMDRSRCRQLLLNLLLNAAEASPRGGTIRVEAAADAGQVTLRISDQGAGFPAAVLEGRTEEFYSTKTTGAGLGLSICRRIVQQAGGQLRLYNAGVPAGGAVAEIVLPAGAVRG